MQRKSQYIFVPGIALVLISLACAVLQPTPPPTPTSSSTPEPTATITPSPTSTVRPSATPRPTQTPNRQATQRAEELNAEVQSYFEQGYLSQAEGRFKAVEDFVFEWAQLGWYRPYLLSDSASDFFMSAHFRWESALENSDIAGCGFMFGIQEEGDHYAVFLDRNQVLFLITDPTIGLSRPVSPTRGLGRVKFDYPAEADFTLIVQGVTSYVLVNGEKVAEYTVSKSRPAHGGLALTVLSGTNKDYGTRCEMTDIRIWLPEK